MSKTKSEFYGQRDAFFRRGLCGSRPRPRASVTSPGAGTVWAKKRPPHPARVASVSTRPIKISHKVIVDVPAVATDIVRTRPKRRWSEPDDSLCYPTHADVQVRKLTCVVMLTEIIMGSDDVEFIPHVRPPFQAPQKRRNAHRQSRHGETNHRRFRPLRHNCPYQFEDPLP